MVNPNLVLAQRQNSDHTKTHELKQNVGYKPSGLNQPQLSRIYVDAKVKTTLIKVNLKSQTKLYSFGSTDAKFKFQNSIIYLVETEPMLKSNYEIQQIASIKPKLKLNFRKSTKLLSFSHNNTKGKLCKSTKLCSFGHTYANVKF